MVKIDSKEIEKAQKILQGIKNGVEKAITTCLLYTSPSPRD